MGRTAGDPPSQDPQTSAAPAPQPSVLPATAPPAQAAQREARVRGKCWRAQRRVGTNSDCRSRGRQGGDGRGKARLSPVPAGCARFRLPAGAMGIVFGVWETFQTLPAPIRFGKY